MRNRMKVIFVVNLVIGTYLAVWLSCIETQIELLEESVTLLHKTQKADNKLIEMQSDIRFTDSPATIYNAQIYDFNSTKHWYTEKELEEIYSDDTVVSKALLKLAKQLYGYDSSLLDEANKMYGNKENQ